MHCLQMCLLQFWKWLISHFEDWVLVLQLAMCSFHCWNDWLRVGMLLQQETAKFTLWLNASKTGKLIFPLLFFSPRLLGLHRRHQSSESASAVDSDPLTHQGVLHLLDNSAHGSVIFAQKGGHFIPLSLSLYAWKILFCCWDHVIRLQVLHIPGYLNILANALSRNTVFTWPVKCSIYQACAELLS